MKIKWLLKIPKIDEKLKTKQLETNSECFSFSITSSIIISFVTQREVYITVDWGICMKLVVQITIVNT
jgi:hypothetical protein